MRKEVKSEDLVVGEVYADMSEVSSVNTFLKYVGRDKYNNLKFEYVSGHKTYRSYEGIIEFPSRAEFYIPLENEL